MKKLGIKYQILLITLLPVFLIDLFFTWSHIDNSIEQANELLHSKSRITARQIAGASEFNLFTGNDSQIQYLLDQTAGNNEIVLASVYNRRGNKIAESADARFQHTEVADYLYHREPILSQSIEYSDVFTPDIDESRQTSTLGWVHLYVSRRQLQDTVRRTIIDSIIFFLSILIMALILTVAISRRITQPIFTLMDHLKDVETGQLGKTISPTEDNEIGAVQAGFNRMTQALLANRRHLNQRIQQATQQLNEAITDLESKNRELGYARDEAQHANRSKSEFLANMSHEIRTPINGIKGFIGLLGQSQLDAKQLRYVEIIQKSTDDLTNIVNEILDFSKMESGKLHIVDEEFDFYEVVEQTRDILFINVLTKSIDLNLIIFSDTPRRLVGDKLRLKQILLNLIGNAIKFTDHGRVVVRVSLVDERDDGVDIEIVVEDTGIGISAEDQQTLFQAFSQVESSDTRRFAGTGLGLVISKNLASLLGGDIGLQSNPGEGSRFVLTLPFGRAAEDDDQHADQPAGPKALVFGADEICLMETRTLFDRAGAITESQLLEKRSAIDTVMESVQRNRSWLDLLVFDLRHLEIEVERLLRNDVTSGLRCIILDYDRGLDPLPGPGDAEFASIISTSRSIAELIASSDRTPITAEAATAPLNGDVKRVLLVDDNRVNLTLASELIRLWGHRVSEAEHGSEALEIFTRETFDLIILDIQMPDIDGVSLMRMMRERDPDNPAPIVALTANVLNDEAGRLLDLGFDYFLSKPIDEESFRRLLDGKAERRASTGIAVDAGDEQEQSVDYAGSLALCADNASLLQQIFEIIRRDIPEQREQLARAIAESDDERLAALVHKLHGVTCYASLPRLKRRVLGLQQRLGGENGDRLARWAGEIDAELAAIEAEIEAYLPDLDADSA